MSINTETRNGAKEIELIKGDLRLTVLGHNIEIEDGCHHIMLDGKIKAIVPNDWLIIVKDLSYNNK